MVRAAYAIVPLRQAELVVEPPVDRGSSLVADEEGEKFYLAGPEDLVTDILFRATDLPGSDPPTLTTNAAQVVRDESQLVSTVSTHAAVWPAEAVESGVDLGGRGVAKPDFSEPDRNADQPLRGEDIPRSDPFTLTPNPALFYPSKQHREAVEGLYNGIRSRKRFPLLSGESGMGKTMVLECLMDCLKQENIEYGFIFNSRLAVGDLFEMLRADFGLDTETMTKTSVLIALNNMLLKFAGQGRTVALIVDEAHQLSTDVLEEIELLSNLETRQGKLLQVVFAARPELETRLGEDALRGLRSRVMRRFRLGPLTEEETAGYIGVRLRQSASGNKLMPEILFSEIYRRTGGVPRMITALCGAAIEACEGTQAKAVDIEMLERVASEFGI